MADNLDTPSFGNFGIEETLGMGVGNTELLSDLFSPETSTEDPDKLEAIVKTADEPQAPKKPEVSKGKEVVQKLDGEETTPQDVLKNFLGDDDDEEEDDNVAAPAKPEVKADEEEDDASESPFVSLSKDLFKLGVFTQDDDEEDTVIETPEQFLEKFNAEKKKGAIEIVDNFIGQFGEDYQKAFDAIFVKGVDPKDYFGVYNSVVSFAELDLSNEDNQVKVIKQALADQGFDSEDITTEVERLRSYGDLETVASKHHKVLVKKEAVKLQQMEQQAEQHLHQKAMIRNQYIQNVQSVLQDKLKTKEFDGIPLNTKLASELQDKDPTLSTIQRTGVTKKSTQLFEEVARQTSKKPGSGGNSGKANSWFL